MVGSILGDLVIVSLFFGLGILKLSLEDGCCFGPRWLLERDFWLFVDSWDFGNQTCVGEAVFWVFWC